jgi:hypothetical protein
VRVLSSSHPQSVRNQRDAPLKESGIHWVGADLILTVTGSSILRVVLRPNDIAVLRAAFSTVDWRDTAGARSGRSRVPATWRE